jgi:glycosyltransferase 2 family protein
MRSKATTLLKIAFSIGLIAWTFSRVPLAEVSSQLASARTGYLVAALAVFVLAILVDGVKWHVLLRAQAFAVSLATVFRFQYIGFFFNNFLPAANLGGDLMRGFGLARITERPGGAAVSVLLDRAFGFLAYMSSAVVASFVAVNVAGRQELRAVQAVAVLAVLAILMALGLLLSRRVRSGITHWFRWRWLSPLARPWAGVSRALDDYHVRSAVFPAALGIALVGLACTVLVNWLVSQAMGGEMTLPMIFLFNPLVALVLILPISVGGLGVSQAAYPFFYGMAGVSIEHALAVSLVVLLIQLVASLPGGYFWLSNRRASQAPAEPVKEGAA